MRWAENGMIWSLKSKSCKPFLLFSIHPSVLFSLLSLFLPCLVGYLDLNIRAIRTSWKNPNFISGMMWFSFWKYQYDKIDWRWWSSEGKIGTRDVSREASVEARWKVSFLKDGTKEMEKVQITEIYFVDNTEHSVNWYSSLLTPLAHASPTFKHLT